MSRTHVPENIDYEPATDESLISAITAGQIQGMELEIFLSRNGESAVGPTGWWYISVAEPSSLDGEPDHGRGVSVYGDVPTHSDAWVVVCRVIEWLRLSKSRSLINADMPSVKGRPR